jgi:branched-chain amino acid aminotransferase
MLNYNGELLDEKNLLLSANNRAFKYGDGLFETIKATKTKVIFWEDHYFRLMASMRMLRMKIPMLFTLEYLEQEILKSIATENEANHYRVRLTIFRKDGGFYTPETNEIDFLIEASPLNYQTKSEYSVDVYKDFYNYSGLLSTVKTTNRMLNTLASIYAKENELDNCVLINENKGVVEVANGNIFIVIDKTVKTPALREGCIRGIVRKKVIEIIQKNPDYTMEETTISPFEIQKADEVFITNAIIGIQPVTQFKKKTFETVFSEKITQSLRFLEIMAV